MYLFSRDDWDWCGNPSLTHSTVTYDRAHGRETLQVQGFLPGLWLLQQAYRHARNPRATWTHENKLFQCEQRVPTPQRRNSRHTVTGKLLTANKLTTSVTSVVKVTHQGRIYACTRKVMTLTFKEDLKKARTEESVAVGVGGLYSKDEEIEVVGKKTRRRN